MTTLAESGSSELSDLLQAMQARTPARILTGRAGPAYRTATQLALRQDHAAAIDAVQAELDLLRDFGQPFVERWGLFEVATYAGSKAEYLVRPDRGRHLSQAARDEVMRRCPTGVDLQIAVGDGLSAAAVIVQTPLMMDALEQGAQERGWRFGQPFVIRYCRVGVLNDLGELLDPAVVVLLVGERPGLATAESLSAYMAYRPRAGHSDAKRNLVSNIHARGVTPAAAVPRILRLAERLMHSQMSGVAVKEEMVGSEEYPELPPADSQS
jgi:ethanolamine ammonia-lyase small subunit